MTDSSREPPPPEETRTGYGEAEEGGPGEEEEEEARGRAPVPEVVSRRAAGTPAEGGLDALHPAGEGSGTCELCGGPVVERHCKIVCRNCGYQRDCSDP